LNAIILEDTISYAWEYEMILDKLDIQVLGVYKSWKDALPIIKKELPDFLIVDLFLDNNEKGLDFIKQMKKYFIPTIVCTGYPEAEYIDEALEAGVKAFISKPLDKASLTFQIKKLVKEINLRNDDNYLVIKDKRNLVKVPFNEIYKIEIERNYSFIYLASSKKYVVKLSLTKLMEQLDEKQFLKCHRSTVINIDYIDFLDVLNNKIVLSNKEELNIGSKFKASLKKAFSKK